MLNDSNTPQSNSFREGVNVPDVGVLGQFAPRLTQQWWSEGVGFAAAILPQGNASARSGVFAAGLDGIPIPKVLSGQPADGADGSEGGFFRSFLGETFADDREYDPFANDFVNMLRLQVRATVSGSAVSVANNEVLWRSDFGRVARKGQPLHPAVPAVVISRFLGHWAESESPRLIMLVKLAGPGVNATNDLAVVMRMESGDFITLLREGDATEGDDGAHIGTIQRVAMEPRQGGYMILASLTGDPRRNQAVFMGKSNTGNSFARSTLRLPQMRLRKGTLYQRAGGDSITTVRSLTCPLMTDISGAGNKGLGNVLVGHQTIFSVEFENKRRAVVTLPTF